MTTLAIDYENNNDTWWDAARAALEDCPAFARPLLAVAGPDSISTTVLEADAFLRWAEALPGWSDGLATAPNPVLVDDDDDDDDDDSPFDLPAALRSAHELVQEFGRTLELLAAAHPEFDVELTDLAAAVHLAGWEWAERNDTNT